MNKLLNNLLGMYKQAKLNKKAEEDLIAIGWGLYTYENNIKANAEDDGRATDREFWNKINNDIAKVESWFLKEGYKKFFTKVRDEGHGKDSELGGTAFVTEEQLKNFVDRAEGMNGSFTLTETSGALEFPIDYDETIFFELVIFVDEKILDDLNIESKRVSKNKKQSSKAKDMRKKAEDKEFYKEYKEEIKSRLDKDNRIDSYVFSDDNRKVNIRIKDSKMGYRKTGFISLVQALDIEYLMDKVNADGKEMKVSSSKTRKMNKKISIRKVKAGYSNNPNYVGDWFGDGQIDFSQIINPNDSGDVYMVKMWCGSGYILDVYLVKAQDDYDAIDKVFEWSYENEGANNIVFDYADIEKEAAEYYKDEPDMFDKEMTEEDFIDRFINEYYAANSDYSLFTREENFFVGKVPNEYLNNKQEKQSSKNSIKAEKNNNLFNSKYKTKIEMVDKKYNEIQTKIKELNDKLQKTDDFEEGEKILKEIETLAQQRDKIGEEQNQLYAEWYKEKIKQEKQSSKTKLVRKQAGIDPNVSVEDILKLNFDMPIEKADKVKEQFNEKGIKYQSRKGKYTVEFSVNIEAGKVDLVYEIVRNIKKSSSTKKQAEEKTKNKMGKSATIKHENGVYNVYSESGKCLGKGYKTKEEAEKRLKQVEYFKNKKAVTGYDYWGPKEMPDEDEGTFRIKYYGGPGHKEYLRKARNGKYHWKNEHNFDYIEDFPFETTDYELAKKLVEQYGGEIEKKESKQVNNKRTSLKQVVISKMAKIKK